MINSLAPIFEQVRVWVLEPAAGSASSPPSRSASALCLFAVWIFNREAPKIAEEL